MKKFLSMALATMMLLGLVACGGDSSSEAAAADDTVSETVEDVVEADDEDAADEAADADAEAEANGEDNSLQKVLDAGKLVMLTNATFPPYEYMQNTADDAVIVNGFTGVDVELANMIAESLGVELEIVDMNFDLLVEGLKNGTGDIVAAGMSITEERQLSVDFSVPYVDTYLSVIVPADSDLTVADLDGLVFSVQENTTSDLLISDPEGWELEFVPSDIQRFKSAVDAGNAVAQGHTDVAVIDQLTAENIVANSGGALKILDETVGHEQYAMAVVKGSTALQEAVNAVLSEAFADGTVDALIVKHMEISKE